MPVELCGATGPKADLVNGTYTSTEERINGMIVYLKLGDASTCLYFAADKSWWVTYSENAKAGQMKGFAHTEIGLSHPTLAKKWEVRVGEEWQLQSVVASVMVSTHI